MESVEVFISDGIFCHYCIGSFVIYNPSTRESKTISCDSNDQFNHMFLVPLFGFGYTDDYKFVKFFNFTSTVEIFSLRNNSWKIVDNVFRFQSLSSGPGICLNRAINWLLKPIFSIAAFDLEEEKFKTFAVPEVFNNKFDYVLGVLGDCLVLQFLGYEEIWGGRILGYNFDSHSIQLDAAIMLPQGQRGDEKLVIYYEELETCKDLNLEGDGIPLRVIYSSDVYVESLISPKFNN